MRVLSLCLIAACGGKAAPAAPVNTAPATGAASTAIDADRDDEDGPEDCTAKVESAMPGTHDRYAFEGADGLYGYKSRQGAVASAPRLRYAYEFSPSGIAAAVDHDGTFVFIDTSGKVIAR